VTNCLEGVDVSDVGCGEGVALVDCFVEKNAAFTAESHRREIVQLGAGTSHGGWVVPFRVWELQRKEVLW